MVALKLYMRAPQAQQVKDTREELEFITTELLQVHIMVVAVEAVLEQWATVDQIEINRVAAEKAWHQTLAEV
jgi:hypothetical protein